jgi:hypothetical protein
MVQAASYQWTGSILIAASINPILRTAMNGVFLLSHFKKESKMKKFILTLAILTLGTVTGRAETLTLTTYYPAPFGAYDQLRLVPRAALSGACQVGTIYVQTPDRIQYCRDNGGTGTWGTFPGVWTQNGNNIYPTDTALNPNLMVGIGTITPSSEFDVRGTITSNVTAKSGNPLGLRIIDTSTLWYLAPARCNGCYAPGAAVGDLVLRSANNKSFLITTANGASTALVVKSDGKVGVGITNPVAKLDVVGTDTVGIRYVKTGARDARIQVGDNVQSWSIASGWATGGDFSIIQENVSGNRLYIQRLTGNVGIGTSTPARAFHVTGDAQVNNLYLTGGGGTGPLSVRYSGGAYYATYAP